MYTCEYRNLIFKFKGTTIKNVEMVRKMQELQKTNAGKIVKVQELEQKLLKDKAKSKLELFAKSFEIAQGQGKISALEVEVELLKREPRECEVSYK